MEDESHAHKSANSQWKVIRLPETGSGQSTGAMYEFLCPYTDIIMSVCLSIYLHNCHSLPYTSILTPCGNPASICFSFKIDSPPNNKLSIEFLHPLPTLPVKMTKLLNLQICAQYLCRVWISFLDHVAADSVFKVLCHSSPPIENMLCTNQ